ncbi:transcriptional regulator [Kroppenstedtia pulmonis]|uniref:Transcriptional regulator n=1 Tax=Kroppenstedtia pulmonis TaxID=1380685 RepID=A0A7D3XJA1_9BACL|nr:PLDc N-terminal domain-containing protein [Kroppenstedtia pulmonis]QKG84719.1 transcriptional regulator [Kroppenstedtia pulmonis]
MDFNWGLILPFILIQLILMTVALVDLVPRKHLSGPKWIWVVIIVVANIIGPILYFILGRKDHT